MAASARTLEASRYWTASGRSLAADIVTAHVGAVAAVQRSEASIVGQPPEEPVERRLEK